MCVPLPLNTDLSPVHTGQGRLQIWLIQDKLIPKTISVLSSHRINTDHGYALQFLVNAQGSGSDAHFLKWVSSFLTWAEPAQAEEEG